MAHFLVYLRLPDLIKFKKIKKVYKFIGVCNIQNEGRGRKKILFARNWLEWETGSELLMALSSTLVEMEILL